MKQKGQAQRCMYVILTPRRKGIPSYLQLRLGWVGAERERREGGERGERGEREGSGGRRKERKCEL